MIPADLRVVQARDLFVAQASLTGESLPVEKVATSRDPQQSNPLECDTLCFMGTITGERHGAGHRDCDRGQYLVRATGGPRQRAGKRAECLPERISRVSMLLIRFMLVMAPIVLIINGYTKGDWWEAALFALRLWRWTGLQKCCR